MFIGTNRENECIGNLGLNEVYSEGGNEVVPNTNAKI